MNDRLKKYFDSLFEGAPDTKEIDDLKEEIFQNTLDRYNDLLAQGKSEEASFTQAIARIGDIDELIEICNIDGGISGENYYSESYVEDNKRNRNMIFIITIVLYVICTLIPIALYDTYMVFGTIIAFLGIAITTGLALYGFNLKIDPQNYSKLIDSIKKTKGDEYSVKDFEKKRKSDNIILSLAVSLFIFSPLLTFVLYYLKFDASTITLNKNSILITAIIMFATAIGTMLFYKINKFNFKQFSSSTMVDEFKSWNKLNSKGYGLIRVIDVVIFLAATFVFIVGGIKTNLWNILSLNFAIAFVLTQIVKQFFELIKVLKK